MSELNVPALLDRDEIGNPVSIARIEAFPLDLELTHSFHIASDSTKTDGTKNVLVRVESQDGYLGFGEAAPFHGISGDTQEGILTDIRSAIDALLNATFNIFRFERIACLVRSGEFTMIHPPFQPGCSGRR